MELQHTAAVGGEGKSRGSHQGPYSWAWEQCTLLVPAPLPKIPVTGFCHGGKLGKKCSLPGRPGRRKKAGEPVVTLRASAAGRRGILGPHVAGIPPPKAPPKMENIV